MCVWWGEGGGAGQTGIEKEINREMENRDRQTDRQTERMEGQIMICFFISYQDMCGGGGGWWWWKGWTDRHRKEDK